MFENDVIKAVHERRSTRSYLDKEISIEHINTLLDAAIWAPSGGNNQSWLFTAIQNKEVLLHLNSLVRKGFTTYIPDDDYPGKHAVKIHAARENFSFYFNAPAIIIASNAPNYENAMADCSLALENIFLVATSLGLGSCYVNQLHWLRDDLNVREYLFELGIPKEHTICSTAVIGYVDKPTLAPARKEGTTNIIT